MRLPVRLVEDSLPECEAGSFIRKSSSVCKSVARYERLWQRIFGDKTKDFVPYFGVGFLYYVC